MKKILLVEDEKVLAKNIEFFLEKEGYRVDTAFDGEEGWQLFNDHHYDVLLLDWTLPKKDGLELCRQIRQQSTVPMIMITAKGEVMDKVIGLEVGADDYIVKPFHQRELLARIHAQLRRQESADTSASRHIHYDDLELDTEQMVIKHEQHKMTLTVNEFKLLDVMMPHPEKVFYREDLFEKVWGGSVGYSDRTVDVNVSRLRKKLLELTGKTYLQAIRSIGYRFGSQR